MIILIKLFAEKDFNMQRKNKINASSCNLFQNSHPKSLSSITDSRINIRRDSREIELRQQNKSFFSQIFFSLLPLSSRSLQVSISS